MTKWPRAFSSEAANAHADSSATARSASYLFSWARSQTVAAFEWSLIGPGSTPSFTARPALTVASIAAGILFRKALVCFCVLTQFLHRFIRIFGLPLLGRRVALPLVKPTTGRVILQLVDGPIP